MLEALRISVQTLTAAVLLFLFAGQVSSQTSPLWSNLKPGPHAIGFKQIKTFDRSRMMRPKVDRNNRLDTSERARPINIFVWYPASKNAQGQSMSFEQYLFIDAEAEDGSLTEQTKRDASRGLKDFYERPFNFPYGRVSDDRWSALLATGTLAKRKSEAQAGSFPLIVAVGGSLSNAVTCELLASNGYIVAVAAPAGDTRGAVGLEALARDLEFVISEMRGFPNVDKYKLGAFGFSFAGMPAYSLAMRNQDVDAIVAMESGIFMDQFAGNVRQSAYYDLTQVRIPFLHMFRRAESERDERLTDFNALRYSKRYRFLVNAPNMLHQDFSTHGIGATTVLGLRGKDEMNARQTFELINQYVLQFFNAHVKKDAAALAYLDRKTEERGAPHNLLSIEIKDAITPALTPDEFIALINDQGIEKALQKFRESRHVDSEAVLFRENTVNALGYQLLQGRRVKEAIEVFKLNVEFFPQSANVYDSLSDAYEADDNRGEAIRLAEKAIERLATDTAINEQAKNAIRVSATEKLRRLK